MKALPNDFRACSFFISADANSKKISQRLQPASISFLFACMMGFALHHSFACVSSAPVYGLHALLI